MEPIFDLSFSFGEKSKQNIRGEVYIRIDSYLYIPRLCEVPTCEQLQISSCTFSMFFFSIRFSPALLSGVSAISASVKGQAYILASLQTAAVQRMASSHHPLHTCR